MGRWNIVVALLLGVFCTICTVAVVYIIQIEDKSNALVALIGGLIIAALLSATFSIYLIKRFIGPGVIIYFGMALFSYPFSFISLITIKLLEFFITDSRTLEQLSEVTVSLLKSVQSGELTMKELAAMIGGLIFVVIGVFWSIYSDRLHYDQTLIDKNLSNRVNVTSIRKHKDPSKAFAIAWEEHERREKKIARKEKFKKRVYAVMNFLANPKE